MSTNTSSYTICSAPNVYIFVYILIETRIAPLTYYSYCYYVQLLRTLVNNSVITEFSIHKDSRSQFVCICCQGKCKQINF